MINGGIIGIENGAHIRDIILDSLDSNAPEKWETKTNMPTPRYYHKSAVVDGIIYVIGGTTNDTNAFTTNEAYDPILNNWTTKAAMITGRNEVEVSVVDNIIYAIAGDATSGRSNVNEAYDPILNSWTTKAPTDTFIQNINASLQGKIYRFGGTSNGMTTRQTVNIYDTVLNSWSAGLSMPVGMRLGAASTVNNDIYCIGSIANGSLNQSYSPKGLLKSISIIGDSIMEFDKDVLWNDETKPANVEFQTNGIGTLSFPITDVSGSIKEKIEKSITINNL